MANPDKNEVTKDARVDKNADKKPLTPKNDTNKKPKEEEKDYEGSGRGVSGDGSAGLSGASGI